MNHELVGNILRMGKSLAPDRFPSVPKGQDDESRRAARLLLGDWVAALGTVCLPAQVWEDAVVLWATHLVGDRMVTPKDLIGAAYTVRDRWESDPQRAALLNEFRVAQANRNYARRGLEPITVADLPQWAGGPPEAVSGAGGGLESLPAGGSSAKSEHRRRVIAQFTNQAGKRPA